MKRVVPALVCLTAVAVMAPRASAQEPAAAAVTVDRVKTRLEQPTRRLVPSGPIELRPVFKSRVDRHPFVLTLDEDLHKTFDLNELQRQSAAWSAQCCGISLNAVFSSMEKALDERRLRKIREQVARGARLRRGRRRESGSRKERRRPRPLQRRSDRTGPYPRPGHRARLPNRVLHHSQHGAADNVRGFPVPWNRALHHFEGRRSSCVRFRCVNVTGSPGSPAPDCCCSPAVG